MVKFSHFHLKPWQLLWEFSWQELFFCHLFQDDHSTECLVSYKIKWRKRLTVKKNISHCAKFERQKQVAAVSIIEHQFRWKFLKYLIRSVTKSWMIVNANRLLLQITLQFAWLLFFFYLRPLYLTNLILRSCSTISLGSILNILSVFF